MVLKFRVDNFRFIFYIQTPYDFKEELMAEANKPAGIPAGVGAYLGPGTKINGRLQFDGPATIEGEVDGEIVAQAQVTMKKEGRVLPIRQDVKKESAS